MSFRRKIYIYIYEKRTKENTMLTDKRERRLDPSSL